MSMYDLFVSKTALDELETEQRHSASMNLDELTPLEIVSLMNEQDASVIHAVKSQLPMIAEVVERLVIRMKRGGRLIYMGAGTSGRLGVLDASECPPTFNSPPEQVVGLIAGGDRALRDAVEGAEDAFEQGAADLQHLHLNDKDTVVAIAASGRTPYALGGLHYAHDQGAFTVALVAVSDSAMEKSADLTIKTVHGAEILTGSTRLKSGTAHKMVLNMISTAVMVQIGKVYQNLMIDLQVSNHKLSNRAALIVSKATHLPLQDATTLLQQAEGSVKIAVLMHLGRLSLPQAKNKLNQVQGSLRAALNS